MTVYTAASVCANIAGPLEVWFAIGAPSEAGTGLVPLQLGWTMSGMNVEADGRFAPIHDDQNGGDQGAPTGYQRLWGNHMLDAEFPRYIPANAAILAALLNPDATSSVGADIVCGTLTFHLWLRGTPAASFSRHYPKCVLVDPIRESPIGSIKTMLGVRLTAMFYQSLNSGAGGFYNTNLTALG